MSGFCEHGRGPASQRPAHHQRWPLWCRC